jgi:hypothetical protein
MAEAPREPGGVLSAIVRWALRLRGIAIALAVAWLAYGTYALSRSKYDVFPEFALPRVFWCRSLWVRSSTESSGPCTKRRPLTGRCPRRQARAADGEVDSGRVMSARAASDDSPSMSAVSHLHL